MPENHLPKYWPFFLDHPVWRCEDNGDIRGRVEIGLWSFNEHTFWHKYTTLYSPCLYRASICAWRIFSPGTTMAGRVRDLRRGAGLPPTGFTSGATPAHPLLQEKMLRSYALRDQWPLCVRPPSQVRSTKIIWNLSTNRRICCKKDTCGPDQIFKATHLSKYCRSEVFSFLAHSKRSSLQTPTGWSSIWQSRDTQVLWGKTPFL